MPDNPNAATTAEAENIFVELSRELRLAQLQARRPRSWTLSSAGYDRVRHDASKQWMTAMVTSERSLLGLPYVVSPAQAAPFRLECDGDDPRN